MRRIIGSFAVGIVAALVMLTAAACNQEKKGEKAKKIEPADVPARVMASVNARFPGAQVTNVEKENEAAGVVYDFELKHDGRKYEMDIKEDGTVMEIEKEVAAKDVPAAVSGAVAAKYPGSTIKEVMEVNLVKGTQETPDHYEVVLKTADGKEMEIVTSLNGAIKEPEGKEKK